MSAQPAHTFLSQSTNEVIAVRFLGSEDNSLGNISGFLLTQVIEGVQQFVHLFRFGQHNNLLLNGLIRI
jgi:hypothetical protein